MRMHIRPVMVSVSAIVLALAATVAWSEARQAGGVAERFTAVALNMGDFGPAQAGSVEIVTTRWSTVAERDTLMAVLMDKGPEALLDALRGTRRVGYIRTPNSLGYDLHFAQQVPSEDGGRRVIVATDRPISFWEAANQPRSIDYPFTLIELRLNRDGEGEGKMSIATKITANKEFNLIEFEDYAAQPVRLTSVRSVRAPTS